MLKQSPVLIEKFSQSNSSTGWRDGFAFEIITLRLYNVEALH